MTVIIVWFMCDIELITGHTLVHISAIPLGVYFAVKGFLISREDYVVIEKHQMYNISYREPRRIQKIEGIVIHATNDKTKYLKRYVDYPSELGLNENYNHWNQTEALPMAHVFIGYNKNHEVVIVNTTPYYYACRCCGKGSKGTYDMAPNGHIQIVICESEDYNKEYFEDAMFGAVLQHCVSLIRKFRLESDTIVSDREVYDLGYAAVHSNLEEWMLEYGKTMEDFRFAVKMRLKGKN